MSVQVEAGPLLSGRLRTRPRLRFREGIGLYNAERRYRGRLEALSARFELGAEPGCGLEYLCGCGKVCCISRGQVALAALRPVRAERLATTVLVEML